MKHFKKIYLVFFVAFIALISSSCGKKYTVKYLNDGNVLKEIEVKKGDKVSNETVSKNGYEFAGWYLNDAQFDFNTAVQEDLTLVAKYNIINYSVKYELNGGINNPLNVISYNIEDEVVLNEPSKDGYSFTGWYTDENYTNSIQKITKGTTGDLTLYAKFNQLTYDISYNCDGSDNSIKNPSKYTIDDEIELSAPSKNGYNFIGWYTDQEYTNEITKINKGTTGNLSLYAKFDIINYSINYVLDEGNNGNSNPDSYTINDEIILDNPSKNGYNFIGWYTDQEYANEVTKINKGTTGDITLYAKWEIAAPRFYITGSLIFEDERTTKLTAKVNTGVTQPKYEWVVENEEIAVIDAEGKNNVTLYGMNPGITNVFVTAKYSDGTVENLTITIEVLGNDFDITYELNQNDLEIFPEDAITTYNTGKFPVELPLLERDYYVFAGWTIEGYDGVYKVLTTEDNIDGNLILSPKWLYPHMRLSFDNGLVSVEEGKSIKLLVEAIDFAQSEIANGFTYKSLNEKFVTIDQDGNVLGVKKGYTEILVSLKDNPSVNTSIGITVTDSYDSMNEVLEYFVSIADSNNIVKNIKVTGWQRIYSHELRTSVIGYLFEDLVITENIAPLGNGVRPGTIYEKKYICVHDTGDVDYSAKDWSNTVYNNFNELTGKSYGASYQYVIDNKDCYHNIPDNERSYHAGDGNRTYAEEASGVYGTEKYPTITITEDGYYAINGEKSSILAPTYNGEILKTSDINDYGIRCVLRDGQYYLGKTWYDTTYRKIGNYGGNNNSIGIESCITEGEDIYYTWQRLAKLVAKLMDENNLTIDDVVTHHYFSGKNCPQTMREAGFWMHFKKLVQIEYQVLQYVKQGYKISFTSNNPEYVNELGRVIKTTPQSKTVSYTITVEKDGIKDSVTLSSVIQFTPYL